jgi:hypothetical protein
VALIKAGAYGSKTLKKHDYPPAKAVLQRPHIARESFCAFDVRVHICTTFFGVHQRDGRQEDADVASVGKEPVGRRCMLGGAGSLHVRMLCHFGRNARQHGKPAWSPYAAAHYVTKMIEDLLQIHQKYLYMQITRANRVSWKKPTPFYGERGTGATGVMVRNEHGELICARPLGHNGMITWKMC